MTTERRQDLAAWLTAVWDEREKDGRYLLEGERVDTWLADLATEVLARIAADRKILALHGVAWNAEVCTVCHHPHEDGETLDNDAWPCLTVRLLASPYADREGFRSEWLVERQVMT